VAVSWTVLSTHPSPARVWRVRKRHDHIDAVIGSTRDGYEAAFYWNDRLLIALPFADRPAAEREVEARRRALHEVGWTVHW
jgi:hypothetical protein